MFISDKDADEARAHGIKERDFLTLQALGFVLFAAAGHKTLRASVQVSFGVVDCFCWSPVLRKFVYQIPCNSCQGVFRVRNVARVAAKGQTGKGYTKAGRRAPARKR